MTTLLNELSLHLDTLHDEFQKVAGAGTVRDLARQFVGIMERVFPGIRLTIAIRGADATVWERFGEAGEIPPPKEDAPFEFHRTQGSVALVQRMFDRSRVALLVSGNNRAFPWSDIDIVALRFFVHLFDTAYQNLHARQTEKALVFSLNHRILQLNSLIDTGIEVASLTANSHPHHLALQRAASLTNASAGTVRVTNGKKERELYAFPEGAAAPGGRKGENRIVARFKFAEDTYTFTLFDKESRKGIIPFESTDQLLLNALVRQVHASLENRFLHQQAINHERIEKELSVAASIQQKIIPVTLPSIPGYEIAGTNIPTKLVGGDYYDCLPLAGGKYALVIADVAGKGIAAALLVSSLHAYLSAYLEGLTTLSQLVVKLNKAIYRASTADKFVTAFVAILTPETGELECVRAGHNPVYLHKNDGRVQELLSGGLPLGMLDTPLPYESESATIQPGERLFLYTDGVSEAENTRHELYESKHPLTEFLIRNKPDRADSFVADLIADIRKFTRSAPQNDDITVMYLHRTI